jgi:hypothetical protein
MAAARKKSAAKPSPARPERESSRTKVTSFPAEKESSRAKLTSAQLEQERLAMIECAVKALIVAHPNRGDLRTIFDVLYAEHRVSQKQSPEPTDPTILAMLSALFQTDAESEASPGC